MTGIVDISADAYHADTVGDQSTLSASIAKILLNASPLHAWTEHPKLNPNFARVEDDKFSVGNVAHAVLLEGRNIVHVVEGFDDWRKDAAKEERDEARANGLTPLLAAQWAEVAAMCDAFRVQLASLDVSPPPFTNGKPEQTVVWEDEGVLCRVRPDWLHDSYKAVDDLKTTSRSANPDLFERTLFNLGYDIQAAMYMRGIRAVTGVDTEFRFVVVETSPPYAVSVHGILPAALELANDKVTWAIRKWRDCLAADRWPGYPSRVCWHEAPGWSEAQWLEREAREQMVEA